MFDKPLGTVKSRIHFARKLLERADQPLLTVSIRGTTFIIIGSGFAGLRSFKRPDERYRHWKTAWAVRHSWRKMVYVWHGSQLYWMPMYLKDTSASLVKSFWLLYAEKTWSFLPCILEWWFTDMPAGYEALKEIFESIEPGSAAQLDKYLEGAAYKYDVGVNKLVYKPGRSLTEFMDWSTISGVFKPGGIYFYQ